MGTKRMAVEFSDIFSYARRQGLTLFAAAKSIRNTGFDSVGVYDLSGTFVSSYTRDGLGVQLEGKSGATERIIIRMSKAEKLGLAKQLLNDAV
jgi:hypothetical protein